MEITHNLGQKIETARKKKKLSQAKLAEIIGVSRASVSLYETGAGNPSYKVLAKLAEVLDLFFSELAGLSDPHYTGSMISRQAFDDINDIRSYLIKEELHRDEVYIEVDFLYGNDWDFEKEPIKDVDDLDIGLRWPTMCVLAIPSVDYTDARIFVVKDSKMGARYPESSRHVFHPIRPKTQWQFLTGIHGVFIAGNPIMIRRIVSNKAKSMTFADAAGNEMEVPLRYVNMIWKVGQTVHMPAEE